MTYTINLLTAAVGIIRILIVIFSTDLFGIHSIDKIGKSRRIFSLIVFIAASYLHFVVINILGSSSGVPVVTAYFTKYFFPIIIAYNCIKLEILYLAVLTDQIISFFSLCISCIVPVDLIGIPIEYISLLVTLFIQVLILFLVIIIDVKSNSNKISVMLKIIPKSIYILLLSAVICLNAISSLTSFDTNNYKIKEKILIVIIITLSVILAFIIISLFLNVIAKQHFTAVSQMMEKQVELQCRLITMIILKNGSRDAEISA